MDRQLVSQIVNLRRELDALETPEISSDLISPYLSLPGLRGFWPMSAVDYTNPQCIDIANGYDLTNNNTATFGYDPNQVLAPCVFLDGVNQFLSRADGGAANWADIIGTETYIENSAVTARGLTILCWFFLAAVPAAQEFLVSKLLFAADLSYFLSVMNTGTVIHGISNNGAAVVQQASSNTVNANAWNFTALRFVPSTTVDVYLNGVKTSLAAGIPASVFDGAAVFHISGYDNGAGGVNAPFAGRISLVPLCAAAASDAEISSIYQQTRGVFGG